MSDMRSEQHGLNITDLPFVIGELGMHGTNLARMTRNQRRRIEGTRTAQANAASTDFNAGFASTKEILGDDPGCEDLCGCPQYHYHKNAKFYYEIGVSMGTKMLELLGGTP